MSIRSRVSGAARRIGGKIEGAAENIGQGIQSTAQRIGQAVSPMAQSLPGGEFIGQFLDRSRQESPRASAANALRRVKRQAGGGQIDFTTSEQI